MARRGGGGGASSANLVEVETLKILFNISCLQSHDLKGRKIQMEGRKGRAVIAAIQESGSWVSFDAIAIFRYTENHYKYQNLTAGAFKAQGQPQTKV